MDHVVSCSGTVEQNVAAGEKMLLTHTHTHSPNSSLFKARKKTFFKIRTLMYVVYGGSKWIMLLAYVGRLQRTADEGQGTQDAFS